MASSVVEVMYAFFVIGVLAAIGGGSYSAYWSLSLRRSLRVKAYARQVLMVGFFSLYGVVLYCLFYSLYFFEPSLQNSLLGSMQEVLYVIYSPLALAWLDSSIGVGRRTDPLLRDPLGWSKLRLVLWPLLILGLSGYLFQGENSTISLFSSYGVLGIAVIPVLILARRSGDSHYRRSLEWLGLALVLDVISNIGYSTLVPGFGTGILYSPTGFIWSVIANLAIIPLTFYGAYRCARSLVPLNRISL